MNQDDDIIVDPNHVPHMRCNHENNPNISNVTTTSDTSITSYACRSQYRRVLKDMEMKILDAEFYFRGQIMVVPDIRIPQHEYHHYTGFGLKATKMAHHKVILGHLQSMNPVRSSYLIKDFYAYKHSRLTLVQLLLWMFINVGLIGTILLVFFLVAEPINVFVALAILIIAVTSVLAMILFWVILPVYGLDIFVAPTN